VWNVVTNKERQVFCNPRQEFASLDDEIIEPIKATRREPSRWFHFQLFSSLRYQDYRYLWSGTLMMSAGQWVQQVTLGWLLYDLTGNSMLLGALNGLRALPVLSNRPHGRRRRRSHGPAQIAAPHSMGLDRHGPPIWRAGRFALFASLAYFSFHADHRRGLDGHRAGAHEHDPQRRPKAEAGQCRRAQLRRFQFNEVIGPALGGALIAWFGAAENFFLQGTAYIGVLA
jgi:hypothetical protein